MGRASPSPGTASSRFATTDSYLYSYDLAGRLIAVEKNGVILSGYDYDENGNRLGAEFRRRDVSQQWFLWMLRVPPLRDLLLSKVLFHELGHHIHCRISPGHGDAEAAAERWRRELMRQVLRRRYWYLLPVFKSIALLGGWRKKRQKPAGA